MNAPCKYRSGCGVYRAFHAAMAKGSYAELAAYGQHGVVGFVCEGG